MNTGRKREKRLREEILAITRICSDYGLIRSSDGNISIRLEDDRFLVTPSGLLRGV
jgi:ribulose-5-phosphate 4-epimerase/fuculose-1-phosphate aldolase